LLVAFTDGLTDAQTAAGESYGDRRLQRLLRTLPADAGPTEALRIVRAAIDTHRAGAPLPDDQMLVIARIG
jgi:serine phosphatase RsbU (regulator of sigma subunit)